MDNCDLDNQHFPFVLEKKIYLVWHRRFYNGCCNDFSGISISRFVTKNMHDGNKLNAATINALKQYRSQLKLGY
jgi:hypothetical protein